jgi:hypothetical protein
MAGNDKLTPFAGLTGRHGQTEIQAVSAIFLAQTRLIRLSSYMTFPGWECTYGELEKPQVWPNGDSSASDRQIEPPVLQPAVAHHENYRSF